MVDVLTYDENKILEYFKQDDWRSIIQECEVNRYLPWVWPSEENLNFIGKVVSSSGAKLTLVSIGCGSGLLEWLIYKCSGISVVGVELDKSWWQSKYAGQTFVQMVFSESEATGNAVATRRDVVLLFCYFNNKTAFLNYLRNFQGNCFIVIGPGEGRSTHTMPEPFLLPDHLEASWHLVASQEIRQSKDFIAVYIRTDKHN